MYARVSSLWGKFQTRSSQNFPIAEVSVRVYQFPVYGSAVLMTCIIFMSPNVFSVSFVQYMTLILLKYLPKINYELGVTIKIVFRFQRNKCTQGNEGSKTRVKFIIQENV